MFLLFLENGLGVTLKKPPFPCRFKLVGEINVRYTLKLLLFGDGGVGKTTLVERYVNGTYKSDTRITIGVQFLVKRLKLNADPIDLQIWDFGGEDRFRFLLPSYCLGASGGIFMYDITSPRSLLHLGDWLEVVRQRTANLPVLVVGTKLDLEAQRSVKIDEAIKVAGMFNLPEVMEVSSKTGYNVYIAFEVITRMMVDCITQSSYSSSSALMHI
jgi:small GTP-binding protein